MFTYGNLLDVTIQDVLELWNKEAPFDTMTVKTFSQKILADRNFDASRTVVALKDGKIVGFLLGVCRKYPYAKRGLEPERAFIRMIVVDKSYQRQGIGRDMLKIFEDHVLREGRSRITVGAYSPFYLYPGIDVRYPKAVSFFKKHGYESISSAVSMRMDFVDYVYPLAIKRLKERLFREGFHFESFVYEDSLALLSFVEEAMSAGWKWHVSDSIEKGCAHDAIIVCKDSQGKIIAYAQRGIDNDPRRFGPFGVAKSFRKRGIGTVLFHEMMAKMRSMGLESTYFLWSGGAAQRFYERQGMQVYRKYRLSCKRISLCDNR